MEINRKNKPVVGIIMGSDSDLKVMVQASEFLEKNHVPYEMEIVSAHRTPGAIVLVSKKCETAGRNGNKRRRRRSRTLTCNDSNVYTSTSNRCPYSES